MAKIVSPRPDEPHPDPKHWHEVRQKVLKRDGHKCVLCGDDKELHVHHITYKNWGSEKKKDLTTLCKEHHKQFHRQNKKLKKKTSVDPLPENIKRDSHYEDERLIAKGNFNLGLKDGFWTEYEYDDWAEYRYEGNYENGNRNGKWIKYHDQVSMTDGSILDGIKIRETEWENGKKNGLETKWHWNGIKSSEINFVDGKKNGIERTWHENGHKWSEKTFLDDKLHGNHTTWYENGVKESSYEWANGKYILLGSWFKNGQPCSQEKCTKNDGENIYTEYFPCGNIRLKGSLINKERNGVWTEWGSPNKKDSEGKYENGKKVGIWTTWYPNGKKQKEEMFTDGEWKKIVNAWNKNGTQWLQDGKRVG